ncbi:MAG: DUF87 domain-containing protein, partial [Candidatus Dormibacteraeota bacterium]|nr:DUF87 domain-containing protein [Candidatus Dormibacteraeota bacterium]
LVRVNAECDIAIHLAPAALGPALNTLGRRLRDFSAHRLLESERGAVGDVHVDIALDSAHALRGRLARNLGRPLHLSITAVARGTDMRALREGSDALRLAFQSALMVCEPAHFRHLAAYLTAMPLAADRLGAVKLVDSSAAALCIPWLDAGCADAHGYRLGETIRGRSPVRLAPFDTQHHTNANIAVLASSGHGKSFTIGALMLEAAVRDVGCIVIDPEGEHAGLVAALGGEYLALAPGTASALNIFDECGVDDDGAVAAVVDLVSVLCGDRLGDFERAIIDHAARDAMSRAAGERRVPLLHDCLPLLESRAPQVGTVVRRHCTGALGALFDTPTTIRFDGDVVGISLRDTPAEHMAAATLIVARRLWHLVREQPRQRHVIFDEVGALCAHPPLRALLVQLARRCRKYSASLVVATQNAQDLLATDDGVVVATNCATLFLGGHRPAETARMEQAFGLTEGQRRFLETAARGDFLLVAGDRRLGIRVELPPEHRRRLQPVVASAP